MDWQPIETAPKNQTQILTFSEAYGFLVASHDSGDMWWNGIHTLRPSHWMPLPAPPAGTEPR